MNRSPKILYKDELRRKKKTWLAAWKTEDRSERMRARYKLSQEIHSLYEKHKDQQGEIISVFKECTGDLSAVRHTIRVGKQLSKTAYREACRRPHVDDKGQVSWSHLVALSLVDCHDQQLQLIKKCRKKGLSVLKLKMEIKANYRLADNIGKRRFTSWTRSLSRTVKRLDSLTMQMPKRVKTSERLPVAAQLDAKTAFQEAATRVNQRAIEDALKALKEAKKRWDVIAAHVDMVNVELEAARKVLLERQKTYRENQALYSKKRSKAVGD